MSVQIENWDFFELPLLYEGTGNPFVDIKLEATFTNQDRQMKVTGFYDGTDIYKFRFMPNLEGQW